MEGSLVTVLTVMGAVDTSAAIPMGTPRECQLATIIRTPINGAVIRIHVGM